MPEIGDRVRIVYRDGRKIEGILRKYYPEEFPWLVIQIELDNGERRKVCVNNTEVLFCETISLIRGD